MKKLLGLVIVLGFVLMIGAAGSADHFGMGFGKLLVLELSGMFIILAGTSVLMHYKNYVRRMMRKRCAAKSSVCRKMKLRDAMVMPEKELC